MTAYHHGNLRAELVGAAVEVARTSGPGAIAIRDVARRTGVSHNAAYRHFRDLADLLGAVAMTGQAELATAMVDRSAAVADGSPAEVAVRRLAEIGRAYVGFALTQPGLFRTAFGHLSDADPRDSGSAAGQPSSTDDNPYALLGAALDEMVATGAMPSSRRDGAETLCWAAVHGFALLVLDGPLAALPVPERDRQLDLVLATVVTGLTVAQVSGSPV